MKFVHFNQTERLYLAALANFLMCMTSAIEAGKFQQEMITRKRVGTTQPTELSDIGTWLHLEVFKIEEVYPLKSKLVCLILREYLQQVKSDSKLLQVLKLKRNFLMLAQKFLFHQHSVTALLELYLLMLHNRVRLRQP